MNETDNTVDRREVQIEKLISAGYVIGSGLESGEMIATAGVNFLKEGQQVQPDIQ